MEIQNSVKDYVQVEDGKGSWLTVIPLQRWLGAKLVLPLEPPNGKYLT